MSGSGVPGEGFNNRQVQIIAVCTLCVTLSTLAVGLRLLVRRVASAAHMWWDDWFTIVALVWSFSMKDGIAADRRPGYVVACQYIHATWSVEFSRTIQSHSRGGMADSRNDRVERWPRTARNRSKSKPSDSIQHSTSQMPKILQFLPSAHMMD